MKEVGAYEAKTHLPKLLDDVAGGMRVVITKHGQPVAVLSPPQRRRVRPVCEVIADLKRHRKQLKLGRFAVRELIDEGRR